MTVKLQGNGSITIPARLRTLAGLSNGVQLEVKFLDGTILIRPKASQSSKAGGMKRNITRRLSAIWNAPGKPPKSRA